MNSNPGAAPAGSIRNKILFKGFSSSIVIVGMLTLLNYAVEYSLLIYLLFPGLVLGLLITGGHGGTELEDKIAAVVSFLVNLLAYTFLCSAAFWIHHALKKKRLP